jgi:hypothetical protein
MDAGRICHFLVLPSANFRLQARRCRRKPVILVTGQNRWHPAPHPPTRQTPAPWPESIPQPPSPPSSKRLINRLSALLPHASCSSMATGRPCSTSRYTHPRSSLSAEPLSRRRSAPTARTLENTGRREQLPGRRGEPCASVRHPIQTRRKRQSFRPAARQPRNPRRCSPIWP